MTISIGEGQKEFVAQRSPEPSHKGAYYLRAFLRSNQIGLLVAFGIVLVLLSISEPFFWSWGNITNLISSNSDSLVLAVGATFVILIGQVDLSATAVAAGSGIVCGTVINHFGSGVVAIVACIIAGGAMGAINGVLISYIRISFLVVTLATMSALTSYALLASGGATMSLFSASGFDTLGLLGTAEVGPFPILIVIDAGLVALAVIILRFTRFGRSVYAVGSNAEAARVNGISVNWVVTRVYIVAGAAGGIAGLIQVVHLTGASPSVDITKLMTVIAAVLIGGTMFSGGRGGVGGTVLGVLFLAVVGNGITLLEISAFWQGAVNAAILLLAVGMGAVRGRIMDSD